LRKVVFIILVLFLGQFLTGKSLRKIFSWKKNQKFYVFYKEKNGNFEQAGTGKLINITGAKLHLYAKIKIPGGLVSHAHIKLTKLRSTNSSIEYNFRMKDNLNMAHSYINQKIEVDKFTLENGNIFSFQTKKPDQYISVVRDVDLIKIRTTYNQIFLKPYR
jgi:hypothetical protein